MSKKPTRFERLVARPKNCATNESITKPALAPLDQHFSHIDPIRIEFGKRIRFINERTGKVISSHENDSKVITNEVIRCGGMWARDGTVYRSGGGIQSYCELPDEGDQTTLE